MTEDFRLPGALVVLWILAFGVFQVGGAWIHALLVLAAVALVWGLVARRREAARTP
jgi:hypothetical protein